MSRVQSLPVELSERERARLESLVRPATCPQQVAVRETARRLGVAHSGTPPTFGAEQICAIVALACERPSDSGRPITHWTQAELADEAVKRGIVASISPDSIGRLFK